MARLLAMMCQTFQSTPSAWRETPPLNTIGASVDISIHSLRMEGDSSPDTAEPMLHDISIHSLRMEGDNVCDCPVCIHYISIHSLRMEGDIRICDTLQILCISIHSLRMEGDN